MKHIPLRVFAAMLTIAGLAIAGCSSESSGGNNLATDAENAASKPAIDTSNLRMAPAWEMMDLDGQIVRSADFAGKVMILDFWATWCGPCKIEIPHFIELQEKYEDDLVIVGASMDRQGPHVVKQFIEKTGVNYLSTMVNRQVYQDYSPLTSIPVSFIITQDGKVYKRYVGYRPKEVFERDIQTLLGPQSS